MFCDLYAGQAPACLVLGASWDCVHQTLDPLTTIYHVASHDVPAVPVAMTYSLTYTSDHFYYSLRAGLNIQGQWNN
jgi:hypothetical protein